MATTVARKIDKDEVDRLTRIIGPFVDDGAYFYVKTPNDVGYDPNNPYDVYVWAENGQYWGESFFGEGSPELFSTFQALCINVDGVYVDSSANHVHRENTGFVTQHGEEVFAHLLLAEHGEHGYLAYPDGAVIRWFGTGERFPSYLAILQEYRKNGWLITEDQWQEMARS